MRGRVPSGGHLVGTWRAGLLSSVPPCGAPRPWGSALLASGHFPWHSCWVSRVLEPAVRPYRVGTARGHPVAEPLRAVPVRRTSCPRSHESGPAVLIHHVLNQRSPWDAE